MMAILAFGLVLASFGAGMMANGAACAVNKDSTFATSVAWLVWIAATIALAWSAGWFANG